MSGGPDVFVVSDSERGLRLDRFLSRRIPRMSRASVQHAIASRVTLSSGAQPKPSRTVFPGEVVTIRDREAEGPAPDAPPILVEREGWMIIDKPAGLASTPNASRPGQDVASVLGLAPAHRLDRFTSGCLLLTWTKDAARHFEEAFRERAVRKRYLAIVHGVPREPAFTVEAPLLPDESSRVASKMRVGVSGDAAVTRVSWLASSPDAGEALLSAEPLTGRRHQVRVHAAHAGHAIVGDLLYGGDERDFVRFQLGQSNASGRHLLHAATLDVPDLDGTRIVAHAPPPRDFPAWAGLSRDPPDASP